MWGLYRIGIRLYGWSLQLAALFHPKARSWAAGRRGWGAQHRQLLADSSGEGPLLWIHCASLGEFEQGRPVMEGLKREAPYIRILLTFYSPSGYEIRRNYAEADYVAYLPLDSVSNARDFLEIWQPELAVFVKYEFWFNYLRGLQQNGIPTVLIAGLFRPGQVFFRPYGKPFLQVLAGFDHLFLQNQASAKHLRQHGIEHFTVAGDTRIDRVCQIAEAAPGFPLVAQFKQNAPVFIVGSSWPEDEAHLLPFINDQLPAGWKAIIAPHQIDEEHLRNIEKGLQLPSCRYSEATARGLPDDCRVLLIDNIGMLSALYQYGKIAYIGGGFGADIHNTLEPIAFGLPVLFGPKYEKFEEARYLADNGGGFVVEDCRSLAEAFRNLQAEEAYENASRTALAYLHKNKGASEQAVRYLRGKLDAASSPKP